MTPSPWYLFRASWRSNAERTYCVRTNLTVRRHNFVPYWGLGPAGGGTQQNVQAAAKRLEDMEIMRQYLRETAEVWLVSLIQWIAGSVVLGNV